MTDISSSKKDTSTKITLSAEALDHADNENLYTPKEIKLKEIARKIQRDNDVFFSYMLYLIVVESRKPLQV